MEERQRQIREGAGLEESRLNTEFIDFLKKYSTPILLVVAVVVGSYTLWTRWKQHTAKKLDEAWVELDSALRAGNPKNLLGVASDHESRGAVPFVAKVTAADIHLDAYRTGVPAGSRLDNFGNLPEGTKWLTSEQRQSELQQAEALYREALALSEGKSGMGHGLQQINAHMGLAAVAESKGEIDAAKAAYTKAKALATTLELDELVKVSQRRMDTLDAIRTAPVLLNNSQLHASVKPAESPFMSQFMNMQGRGPNGETIPLGSPPGGIQVTPITQPGQPAPGIVPIQIPNPAPTPGGTPGAAPAPSPAPAPTPTPEKPAEQPKP